MKFLVILLAAASAVPADLIQPQADDCSFIVEGDAGNFTSVRFPDDYDSNSNCSWLIISGSNTAITLRFETFLTEANADFVKVYDGVTTASELLATFSGFSIPPAVSSTSNIMLVTFTSNNVNNYAGFYATYTSSPVTPISTTTLSNTCSRIEIGYGLIQSPNHPSNYPNRIKCLWFLQSNSASSISVEFLTFATERKNDYVEVYEGWVNEGSPDSKPVATYSGVLVVPFTYATTATNQLTVRFVSDETDTDTGFSAYFTY